MPTQIIANPIFDWSTSAVWLYLLTRKIRFNAAYRYGFARVGCYPCPFNSSWFDFLLRHLHPDLFDGWQDRLLCYAREHMPTDPERYVKQGIWKGRFGGRGRSNTRLSEIDYKPCVEHNLACGYSLVGGWKEHFFELLRPLGVVRVLRDDGITASLALDDKTGRDVIALLRISRPRGHISVTYVSNRAQRQLTPLLESQIRKVQACVGCGGCASLCPQGAIAVERSVHRIDDAACTRCLRCVRRLRNGCLAAHSVHA